MAIHTHTHTPHDTQHTQGESAQVKSTMIGDNYTVPRVTEEPPEEPQPAAESKSLKPKPSKKKARSCAVA